MPQNYVLLERIELNASAASVTFSNIPQTGYTDLKIVISSRDTNTGSYWSNIRLTFNGSTTGYTAKLLYDADGAVGSDLSSTTALTFAYSTAPNSTASTFGNTEFYIPNYAGSSYKSVSSDSVTENNGTNILLGMQAGLWSNTAAINQITFTPANSASFVQYSTFSLYGIANASTTPTKAPKASGGNVIATDGTYWYHAFLSSGTFTPAVGLSCDYLVVAGGGGGGSYVGGGGAGGLRSTVTATGGGGSLESALALTANTSYTVTVGAGGAGATADGSAGTAGSNSVFSTITSTGGGYGGGYNNLTGGNGGSGGGGAVNNIAAGNGGTRVTGQGYAGGNGFFGTSSAVGGGGGGGAGAVGTNGSNATGGAGGAGVAISAFATATGTGVSNYYAGGGGGSVDGRYASAVGSGGAGGGGAGSWNAAGGSGTVNTGSGGGAGTYNGGFTAGGAGGSGIVIVRYLVA